MKPGKLDLPTIWRGCDWGPVTLKWKDANGNPIDVRSWTPKAQSLNVDLNAQKIGSPPGILGETQMVLTKAQTLHLKLGTENWDWIWQANNQTYRFPPFLSGKVTIKEPVTSVNGDTPPGAPEAAQPAEPPLAEFPS
jgi:hypothetical protein